MSFSLLPAVSSIIPKAAAEDEKDSREQNGMLCRILQEKPCVACYSVPEFHPPSPIFQQLSESRGGLRDGATVAVALGLIFQGYPFG